MYSWRLIMAPPEVLHYVAAHEVAHLREMNHGREFLGAGGRSLSWPQDTPSMAAAERGRAASLSLRGLTGRRSSAELGKC